MGALTRTAMAAGAGAAVAYLFDPDRGRSRRARLADQSRALGRREMRALERRASYQRGRAEGVVQRFRHRDEPPADDRALADRVRTEAGGGDADRPHLTVDAVDGVVTLRGEVGELATAMDIERRVREIPGVADVVNLLHGPGSPAPNKLDALHARSPS